MQVIHCFDNPHSPMISVAFPNPFWSLLVDGVPSNLVASVVCSKSFFFPDSSLPFPARDLAKDFQVFVKGQEDDTGEQELQGRRKADTCFFYRYTVRKLDSVCKEWEGWVLFGFIIYKYLNQVIRKCMCIHSGAHQLHFPHHKLKVWFGMTHAFVGRQ